MFQVVVVLYLVLALLHPGAEASTANLPKRQKMFRKFPGVVHESADNETVQCDDGACSVTTCTRACMQNHHCVLYSHSPSHGLCVLGGPLFSPLGDYDVPDPAWNTYKSECPLYAGWEFATYDSGQGTVCLKVVNDFDNFHDDAETVCNSHGASLIMVKNMSFYQFIKQLAAGLGVTVRLWVGAKKSPADKEFYWADGTLLPNSDEMWRYPEQQRNHSCVFVRPHVDYRLWSAPCAWKAAFICQFDF